MSGYKNFAVVGAGEMGSFIIRQLITDQAAGTINNIVVLTRQASLASARQMPALIGYRDLKPLLTLPQN